MTARDVKSRFGEFLDSALREPIVVTKNDLPVGIMISLEEAKDTLFADFPMEQEPDTATGFGGGSDAAHGPRGGRYRRAEGALEAPEDVLKKFLLRVSTESRRLPRFRLWATLKAAVVSDKGLPYPLPAGRYIVQQPFRHRRRKAGISCIPIWPIASSLKVHNKPCFEKDRLSPEFVDKFVGGG